jgi:hypothetical protein
MKVEKLRIDMAKQKMGSEPGQPFDFVRTYVSGRDVVAFRVTGWKPDSSQCLQREEYKIQWRRQVL